MNDLDLRIDFTDVTTRLFRRLRKGFKLGMGEYLVALDVIRWETGPKTLADLKLTLRLLWCHSLTEQEQLEDDWDAIATLTAAKPKEKPSSDSASDASAAPEKPEAAPPTAPEVQQQLPQPPQPEPEVSSDFMRTPYLGDEWDDGSALQTYFPVSRRSLSYFWRYLRRPVADGSADVFDLSATVQQVSRQGFFLAPVYTRRNVNHARLVLLIDQDGSMAPFHRFTRDLVETVWEESSLQPENTSVYYFYNVPTSHVYIDSHCTSPVTLAAVLASCDSETSVLIVSDAGAARGYRRMERVRLTTEFLVKLKQRTNLIGWLNPMPEDRWAGTSAGMIRHLVRMEPMNDDGMSNTIDTLLRGQPLSS